jgi:hypothetical protein
MVREEDIAETERDRFSIKDESGIREGERTGWRMLESVKTLVIDE